ncbi:MAG: ABC transporter substrate-binding protein [Alphaproteobacteria bacterium]|nr:ABC transporter substrate-binding protein [Alphaproteobacteria bacterium]
MPQPRSTQPQFKELLLLAVPAILAVAFAFWFAYQFVEPAPPSNVAIATGSETGGYFAFAKRYKALLAKSDINLEVKSSAGSLQNLATLRDDKSGVTLGLLQGGISNRERDPQLVSLGRVFLEPVWVFYRSDAQFDRLGQLQDKRIAIGPEGSGTRALALELLAANQLTANNTTILDHGGAKAAQALRDGEADAIFLVLSPQAALVADLLKDPQIRLMSFSQAEAYTRLFPYLSRVSLPAGVIDLANQIPSNDVTLVAAQAALVARNDVHPAIVGLMVQAAREVHKEGGIFQRVQEFPKPNDPEYPMQEDAERLYTQGPPFLQRFLPFWLANFIERSLIMIIPVATIMLPLIKVVPWLYEFRIRRRILHWYGQLKALEKEVDDESVVEKARYSEEIKRIEGAVSKIPVPLHYSDKLYELRGAVDLVRQRIAALQ